MIFILSALFKNFERSKGLFRESLYSADTLTKYLSILKTNKKSVSAGALTMSAALTKANRGKILGYDPLAVRVDDLRRSAPRL
jgi:hypothetical protein